MDKRNHRLCEKPSLPKKRTYVYSENVARLLRMASTLTPQETVNLCCGLVKRSRMTPANLNTVKNYIVPRIKEIKANDQEKANVSSATSYRKETENAREHQGTAVSSASRFHKETENANEHQRTAVSSASRFSKDTDYDHDHQQAAVSTASISRKNSDNAREHQRTVVSSASSSNNAAVSSIRSIPHHKVPLIVRADLIEEGCVLAFDTEKVIQHLSPTTKATRIVAGDFALVDLQGRVVMWCYIYRENVCVYNTQHTGLNEAKIMSGINETTFLEILSNILKGNLLVGAAIKEDLKHLGLDGRNLPTNCTTFDIQSFFKDEFGESVSLAQLGEHFTGQHFQEAAHSSLADARMTALAYKRMLKFKSEGYLVFNCPDFDDFRAEMKEKKKAAGFKKRWEKCKCFLTKPKFTPRSTWGDMKQLPGI